MFTEVEGFANSFEIFLTDYKKAMRVVPNMVAEFHKIIRENDDIRQQLEKLDVWKLEDGKQGTNVVPILGVTEDPRFYGLTPMCAPIHVSV